MCWDYERTARARYEVWAHPLTRNSTNDLQSSGAGGDSARLVVTQYISGGPAAVEGHLQRGGGGGGAALRGSGWKKQYAGRWRRGGSAFHRGGSSVGRGTTLSGIGWRSEEEPLTGTIGASPMGRPTRGGVGIASKKGRGGQEGRRRAGEVKPMDRFERRYFSWIGRRGVKQIFSGT